MSMKILSLAIVSGALALSSAQANAESLSELIASQISDRSVQAYSGSTSGHEASVTEQEVNQFGNSAQPDVDASASRGHDDSLVRLQYEQIPH